MLDLEVGYGEPLLWQIPVTEIYFVGKRADGQGVVGLCHGQLLRLLGIKRNEDLPSNRDDGSFPGLRKRGHCPLVGLPHHSRGQGQTSMLFPLGGGRPSPPGSGSSRGQCAC